MVSASEIARFWKEHWMQILLIKGIAILGACVEAPPSPKVIFQEGNTISVQLPSESNAGTVVGAVSDAKHLETPPSQIADPDNCTPKLIEVNPGAFLLNPEKPWESKLVGADGMHRQVLVWPQSENCKFVPTEPGVPVSTPTPKLLTLEELQGTLAPKTPESTPTPSPASDTSENSKSKHPDYVLYGLSGIAGLSIIALAASAHLDSKHPKPIKPMRGLAPDLIKTPPAPINLKKLKRNRIQELQESLNGKTYYEPDAWIGDDSGEVLPNPGWRHEPGLIEQLQIKIHQLAEDDFDEARFAGLGGLGIHSGRRNADIKDIHNLEEQILAAGQELRSHGHPVERHQTLDIPRPPESPPADSGIWDVVPDTVDEFVARVARSSVPLALISGAAKALQKPIPDEGNVVDSHFT